MDLIECVKPKWREPTNPRILNDEHSGVCEVSSQYADKPIAEPPALGRRKPLLWDGPPIAPPGTAARQSLVM
jgi:hypothetical protein